MLRANSDAIRYGMVRMGKLRGRARASEWDQSPSTGPNTGRQRGELPVWVFRCTVILYVYGVYVLEVVPRGDAGIGAG